jgi:phosphohistidine phosphatase
MLTLFLMRHAKSSWAAAGTDDFDRPLAPRGVDAAPRTAQAMAENGFTPDRILCSSARRTRQTLGLVLTRIGADEMTVTFTRQLYGADVSTLHQMIAAQDARSVRRLMLVGHNPAMQDLALQLTGDGAATEREALEAKFPSGALAVLTFEDRDGWASIAPGTGHLTHFIQPRFLD